MRFLRDVWVSMSLRLEPSFLKCPSENDSTRRSVDQLVNHLRRGMLSLVANQRLSHSAIISRIWTLIEYCSDIILYPLIPWGVAMYMLTMGSGTVNGTYSSGRYSIALFHRKANSKGFERLIHTTPTRTGPTGVG